ncbi:MAG: glycosyltransferase, partial [Spirochaetales bacterium]|nr:glycosyltransferase [Spirochaetales bacterium]
MDQGDRGGRPAVLLVSGLSLRRASSFSRQLRLLAAALERRGVPGRVCSPAAALPALRGRGACAAILLGYPDQFPLLAKPVPEVPVYLWAQFSRPSDPAALAAALPVPLTARSAGFLAAAGCVHIGPVIPHGVDLRLYRPAAPGERARARERLGLMERFVVGAVGAHTARKRFGLLLETLARLLPRLPQAALLIKTDRPVALDGTDLREQARRLGVGAAVRLVSGTLPAAAMADLYRSMDVYLNLSEWEGFCVPVVEAMACGVPVAAQPGQGPGELVPYGELLVPGSAEEADGATILL